MSRNSYIENVLYVPTHWLVFQLKSAIACICVVFCRQFVEACGLGLGVNERLIKEDQQEYHDEMKANYRDLTKELSAIMHEPVRHKHTDLKGIVHPKMKIMSLITHPRVDANLYECLSSVKHKWRYFEECW